MTPTPILVTGVLAAAAAIPSVGNAMADAVEAAELFDVEVDKFAWPLALVTRAVLSRFDCWRDGSSRGV